MVFPVVYLVVLGNAMNRPLENVPLAVVDEAGNALLGGVSARGSRAPGRPSARRRRLPNGPAGRARGPASRPLPRDLGPAVRLVAVRAALPRSSETTPIASATTRSNPRCGRSGRRCPRRATAPPSAPAVRARGVPVPRLPHLPRPGGRVPGHLHGLDGVGRAPGPRGPHVRVPRGLPGHADLDGNARRGSHPRRLARRFDCGRPRAARHPVDHSARSVERARRSRPRS